MIGTSTAVAGSSARESVGGPAVVALGGGHGLAASLSALRRVTDRLTAVVTVADDGGSSGRLRKELAVLPPGDLRMALAALCGDDEWGTTWSRVLQHRFAGDGPLRGHAVGNLLMVGLWEELGDTVAGLDWLGRLLGAQGRVLPMTTVPLELVASVAGLTGMGDEGAVTTVHGQVAAASTQGRVLSIALLPSDPPAEPAVLAAIESADWVVLGPGSWFTSVMPHLMVPDIAAALQRTDARVLVLLNLAQDGETGGVTPQDHLELLHAHAPHLVMDVVVADPSTVSEPALLAEAVRRFGGRLELAALRRQDQTDQHDPILLAHVLDRLLNEDAATLAPWPS